MVQIKWISIVLTLQQRYVYKICGSFQMSTPSKPRGRPKKEVDVRTLSSNFMVDISMQHNAFAHTVVTLFNRHSSQLTVYDTQTTSL